MSSNLQGTSVTCVGHNTVDKYVNLGMMYPGGNEVNVASHLVRNGIQASYLGWVGNDVYGNLLIDALRSERVDISHCHIKNDVNTYTEIFLENGERRFGDVRRGASTKSTLTSDDLEFILSHDVLHTSYYSRMENFLEEHYEDIRISFDCTELADETYLRRNLPFIEIAILPLEVDDQIEATMRRYHDLGAKIILVTMGSKGAYAYDGTLFYQPALKGEVVDTLGAGDAFIARFLAEHLKGTPIDKTMMLATQSAYDTCQHYGAIGYGISIQEKD